MVESSVSSRGRFTSDTVNLTLSRLDFIIRGRTYEASVDLRTAGRLFEAPPIRLSEANMKSSYQKDRIKEFRERITCIKKVRGCPR